MNNQVEGWHPGAKASVVLHDGSVEIMEEVPALPLPLGLISPPLVSAVSNRLALPLIVSNCPCLLFLIVPLVLVCTTCLSRLLFRSR